MTATPYPTFYNSPPVVENTAVALSAVGRCRIYPQTCHSNTEEFQAILDKAKEQAMAIDKTIEKKYMKQGVAMANKFLSETLGLDPSIVDIEIVLEPEMIFESEGCIMACFLDAGCDKIVVNVNGEGDGMKALEMARVPKERLAAHFDLNGETGDDTQSRMEKILENQVIKKTSSFTNSLSISIRGGGVSADICVVLMKRVSVVDPNISIVLQMESSATGNISVETMSNMVGCISKFFGEKTGMKGTVSLVDPTAEQLGMSYAACIRTDRPDGLYTTVVCTRSNEALGLVYSSKASIIAALECGRGVYHSRSRNGLWRKGDTSGHYQTLHRLDVDCDGDALRFTVTQRGDDVAAFCHLNTLTCWGESRGIRLLEGTLRSRLSDSPEGSYTKRLFEDDELLQDKLIEEAQELCEANDKQHVAEELADVLYFAMVKAAKLGVSIDDAVVELDKRARKVTRRKGDSKPFRKAVRISAVKDFLKEEEESSTSADNGVLNEE